MPIAPARLQGLEACYDLEATVLGVRADRADLLEGLDYFLAERRMPVPDAPTFLLDITVGAPGNVPDGAEILYHGPLHDEGNCVFARTADSYWLVFPGTASLRIRPGARTAEIVATADGLRHTHGSMIALALEFVLDADGQQVVHCAGLSFPGSDRVLLLCAPSGTGKTTTALALARAGFALAADDAMVLRKPGDEIRAWGLPRAVKIHQHTVEMLPWLNAVTGPGWDAAGEQALARATLKPLFQTDDRTLRVTDILLLRRGTGPDTMIRPFEKAEMLAALAADNLRNSAAGPTSLQMRRYAMLANVVNFASTQELTISPGMVSLPGVIRTLLDQASLIHGPDQPGRQT